MFLIQLSTIRNVAVLTLFNCTIFIFTDLRKPVTKVQALPESEKYNVFLIP